MQGPKAKANAGGAGDDGAADDDGPETGRIQDFIFARELAEVYLLLDNVSTSADKALPEKVDLGHADGDWIRQICQISWPPKGAPPQQAEQAATLLKVRDRLNTLASPATGATIAFTLLVAGEDDTSRRGAFGMAPLFRPAAKDEDSQPPVTAAAAWGAAAPSRRSLASLAFPGLVRHAAHFRLWMRVVITGLFAWLILTCALSWDVAAGTAIMARLNSITAQKEAVDKQIADAEAGNDGEARKPGGGGPAPAAAAAAAGQAVSTQLASTKPVYRYCERSQLLPPETPPPPVKLDRFDNVTEMRLCDQNDRIEQQYLVARAGVAQWLAGWRPLLPLLNRHVLTVNSVETSDHTAPSARADEELQWASIVVGVLASAVLPVAYGILGAGAAVLRSLSRKMKESLLSPRDLQLSLVQLALGAVIGACVGLFVTPSSAAATTAQGLIGSIPLSASALCFIAGFGVESVFVALEALLTRVFNVAEPARKKD